jgi:hypothetical protein
MRVFKIIILFLLCSGVSAAYGQYTTKKIHDLKGITDSSGTVHLFYRIFELGEPSDNHPRTDQNHIYHLNTQSEVESFFLRDEFSVITFTNGDQRYSETRVLDYAFPTKDQTEYIYSTLGCRTDCVSSVMTHDSVNLFHRLSTTAPRLVRHPDKKDTVYLAYNNETRIVEKNKEGWRKDIATVDSITLPYHLISVHPNRDSLFIGIKDHNLIKSDGSDNYAVVDTTRRWDEDTRAYYGGSSNVMYLQSKDKREHQTILTTDIYRSAKSGDRGSWKKIYGDSSYVAFESNPAQNRIFIGDGKQLLVSNDHGEEFTNVNTFKYPITSLYQPDNRNLELYVRTKFSIWKLVDGKKTKLLKKVTTNLEDDTSIPSKIELMQNYPNPFNPSTNIRFSLSQAEQVTVNVYNTIGQRIETLINRQMTAGSHSVTFNAEGLPSGVYIYRLEAGKYSESQKMLLVK